MPSDHGVNIETPLPLTALIPRTGKIFIPVLSDRYKLWDSAMCNRGFFSFQNTLTIPRQETESEMETRKKCNGNQKELSQVQELS